jgi:four helix bundle protein
MQDYRNLQVWTKSHSLALLIYAATRVLPADERFGLASQLRRAASSIPANIA